VGQYTVRVRLPDRPGALGQVASRIGAVGGDIVAIHILSRSAGQAVDEFVVQLAGGHLTELLRNEIHEVDGVTVEEVREESDISGLRAGPNPGHG
jgi:ACT domain-containing protein